MTQSQTGIQVKELQSTTSLSTSASFMALTDATNNTVNLITLPNVAKSLVSSTVNNGLTYDANGLYVPDIGDLSQLETEDKTSIVNAINENTEKLNQTFTTLATSGTIALADNSTNKIVPTALITFTLPTITNNNFFHQILVQVKLTNVDYISADNNRLGTNNFFNNLTPAFTETGYYNLIYEYDSNNEAWVCGSIYKGAL